MSPRELATEAEASTSQIFHIVHDILGRIVHQIFISNFDTLMACILNRRFFQREVHVDGTPEWDPLCNWVEFIYFEVFHLSNSFLGHLIRRYL